MHPAATLAESARPAILHIGNSEAPRSLNDLLLSGTDSQVFWSGHG